VVKVEGPKCPKGEAYAVSEVEDPQRILTSVVRAKGLSLKMVPVRTDKPIPKSRLKEGMEVIKKVCIVSPVRSGDVIRDRFLGLDVNLVATRDAAG
jgi:CxxC motif-containing protein